MGVFESFKTGEKIWGTLEQRDGHGEIERMRGKGWKPGVFDEKFGGVEAKTMGGIGVLCELGVEGDSGGDRL